MKKQKILVFSGLALLAVLTALVAIQGTVLWKIYQERAEQHAPELEAVAEVPELQFEPKQPGKPQASTAPSPIPARPGGSPFSDPFFQANGLAGMDPFERMRQMRAEMDLLFGDFGLRGSFDLSFSDFGSGLGMQVREEDEAYVVTLKLNADEVENLDIQSDGKQLSVAGTSRRRIEQRNADGSVSRQESARQFRQSFTLPGPVKADEVTSAFEDGVLTITLPKESASTPADRGPRSLV